MILLTKALRMTLVSSYLILSTLYNYTLHLVLFLSSYFQATLCKKVSNHHANLPLEMYSFTL